jgi:hypothetical protein
MNRRTGLRNELVVCWSHNNYGAPRDAGLHIIELFAIDLIHAELRLRRCDMEETSHSDFDCDSNFVGLVIPSLLSTLKTIEQQLDSMRPDFSYRWKSLKVRLYWLVASWYFWRGRHSVNVMDSRDAEMQGLEWIESINRYIQIGDVIPTPHLTSPTRVGLHWKEVSLSSISSFSGEIQASAAVLLAQEQFMDVSRKFEGQETAYLMKQEDCDALSSIGETLMRRYPCSSDESSKIFEIIDDFFNVHGESFYSLSMSSSRSFDSTQSWFDSIVPSRRIESGRQHIFPSSPCVLTILVNCLCTKPDHCVMTVLLMSNLVVTLLDLSEKLLCRKKIQWDRKLRSKVADDVASSYSSDSEDSISGIDDEDENSNRKQSLNAEDFKIVKYAVLIRVLLTKILSFCTDSMSREECVLYAQSVAFERVLSRALTFTTELYRFSRPVMNDVDTPDEDLGILIVIQRLFQVLVLVDSAPDSTRFLNLMRIYIDGIFYIVTDQRQILSNLSKTKPNKNRRALRLKTTRKRADLVATASFDAGYLLSKNLATICAGRVERSNLFGEIDSPTLRASSLAAFLDSLLWFWKASSASSVHSNSDDRKSIEESHLSAYLDGFGRERLRVPIATAIVGLCGSACYASATTGTSNVAVSLIEFYDSDVSAIKWKSNLSDDEESICFNKKDTIRVIAQAVHCVSKVFSKIDETEVCSYPYIESYSSSKGPGLAIVVARVLNFFAGALLVQFRGKGVDALESLWIDYPYGTQTTGALVDSVLWKAYKCLHGFSITNDTKESVSCPSGTKQSHHFLPESKEAAAMLYRCIMRAYSHGRRTPPKAALEAVLAVLPRKEDSCKMLSIRNFLFSPTLREDEMEQLIQLASQHIDFDTTFRETIEFDWLTTAEEDGDDEASRVLRGLSRLISQGPIPRIPDCGDEKDWRSSSTQSEEELSTKFNALIDNLCFGNTKDWEGWFKASQCLNMKSDLIADRLGLSRGFTRSHNFCVPGRRHTEISSVQLAELLLLQEREQCDCMTGCVRSLGADMSLFVRFHWSSFESLTSCFQDISQFYESIISGDSIQVRNDGSSFQVWREIRNFYEKSALCRWQHAMGGLFVASLRLVAYRCLLLSLILLNDVNLSDKDLYKSELAESLGVSLYVELMGSQVYGYPMKSMTDSRKRDLAVASSSCFEQAIKLTHGDDDLSGRVEAWDLLFMMGKVRTPCVRNAY